MSDTPSPVSTPVNLGETTTTMLSPKPPGGDAGNVGVGVGVASVTSPQPETLSNSSVASNPSLEKVIGTTKTIGKRVTGTIKSLKGGVRSAWQHTVGSCSGITPGGDGSPPAHRSFSSSSFFASSSSTHSANNNNNNNNKDTSEFDVSRRAQFTSALDDSDVVDMETLRQLSWCGVPPARRALVWSLLTGYAPPASTRRLEAITRKRTEYSECAGQHSEVLDIDLSDSTNNSTHSLAHYVSAAGGRITESDLKMRKQIYMDAVRTCPGAALFQSEWGLKALQRILYVWSARHPASGYVQGINDLATPFMCVFLLDALSRDGATKNLTVSVLLELAAEDVGALLANLEKDALVRAEADAYWCFSKLLDSIQDYYTFAQRGLQQVLHKLAGIVHRIDPQLHQHLVDVGLDYTHFAFRWFNCLLMRELPMTIVVRVWDTYLAEGPNFPDLHVYVCAALLCGWSHLLLQMDFGEIMIFLQNPPTATMSIADAEELLSKSFMYQQLFANAQAHLDSPSASPALVGSNNLMDSTVNHKEKA
eukprot:PhM_4_TR18474/c0_g1_i2/m.21220/K20360/TBC1D22, GYP1; TBC1 domain family member 2